MQMDLKTNDPWNHYVGEVSQHVIQSSTEENLVAPKCLNNAENDKQI